MSSIYQYLNMQMNKHSLWRGSRGDARDSAGVQFSSTWDNSVVKHVEH